MREIIKALELIKKTCEEQADCETCPFGNADNDCVLHRDAPSGWTIPEKQIIRLLV